MQVIQGWQDITQSAKGHAKTHIGLYIISTSLVHRQYVVIEGEFCNHSIWCSCGVQVLK